MWLTLGGREGLVMLSCRSRGSRPNGLRDGRIDGDTYRKVLVRIDFYSHAVHDTDIFKLIFRLLVTIWKRVDGVPSQCHR
jgi:hypothetical protein